MAGGINIRNVEPLTMAAVRRQVTGETMSDEVVRAPIWSLVEARGLKGLPQTVVLYYDDGHDVLLNRPGGVPADIGVVVEAPFEGDLSLQCVRTPAGRVAHYRHHGHYEMLPVVHADIRAWCIENGHEITGVNWDHYSVWHEESALRITDIYYLLADQSQPDQK